MRFALVRCHERNLGNACQFRAGSFCSCYDNCWSQAPTQQSGTDQQQPNSAVRGAGGGSRPVQVTRLPRHAEPYILRGPYIWSREPHGQPKPVAEPAEGVFYLGFRVATMRARLKEKGLLDHIHIGGLESDERSNGTRLVAWRRGEALPV